MLFYKLNSLRRGFIGNLKRENFVGQIVRENGRMDFLLASALYNAMIYLYVFTAARLFIGLYNWVKQHFTGIIIDDRSSFQIKMFQHFLVS